MDKKYERYRRIHQAMIRSARLGSLPEGKLIIAVIGQAIQDAMGMYGSDSKVYIENEEGGRKGREKRSFMTRQEEATQWLADGRHYELAEIVGLNIGFLDELIITRAGVKL